jgi:hypothetical protein
MLLPGFPYGALSLKRILQVGLWKAVVVEVVYLSTFMLSHRMSG